MDKTTAYDIFEQYYQALQQQEQAVLPDERLAILDRMERDLTDQGIIPIGIGEIAQFNTDHATYAAILRGDAVTIGGEIASRGQGVTVKGMPKGVQFGLLGLVFLLPVLLSVGLVFWRSGSGTAVDMTPTAATTAMAAAESPTTTPTETVRPTMPPPVVITMTPSGPTPTPLPISGLRGAVAELGNDPASVEVAGESFILAVGTTSNGIWLPKGAEWLDGSILRRVIAVPYSPQLAAKLEVATGDIRLRLRSGEVVSYRIEEIGRYRRNEIEILAGDSPSIVIILAGEEGDERLVLVGRLPVLETVGQTEEVMVSE